MPGAPARAGLRLDALLGAPIPPWTKGLPARVAGTPLGVLGDLGLDLLAEDLPLPAAVLRESALAHNLAWMTRFCERAGVAWAPHGKTHMAPQLLDRQLRAGAWGVTAATGQQVQAYRAVGVDRILLANQLVDRAWTAFVVDELRADPAFTFLCLVDSVEGVERLAAHVRAAPPIGRPVEVLLEVGAAGVRTGARTPEAALAVARAVRDAGPALALRGVEALEGLFIPDDDGVRVHALLDDVAAVAAAVADQVGDGPVVLTAGGSCHLDLAAARLAAVDVGRPTQVVLRSGCTVTSDAGAFAAAFAAMAARSPEVADGEGLRPALEVWAGIQSRPDPDLALATAGRRDVGSDLGMPVPQRWFRPGWHDRPQPLDGHEVVGLNDQHTHLRLPAGSPLAVGDLVQLGISHPCTTFDRWPVLLTVDDDLRVTGGIRTLF